MHLFISVRVFEGIVDVFSRWNYLTHFSSKTRIDFLAPILLFAVTVAIILLFIRHSRSSRECSTSTMTETQAYLEQASITTEAVQKLQEEPESVARISESEIVRVDYCVLPAERVPDRLTPIFNSALPYAQRMVCLEQVRLQGLDANEAHALLQLLHYSAAQTGMTEEYTHALKNEVANALKQSPIDVDEFGRHLMSMAQDEAEPDVWRDYCIQHLGSILPGLSEHRREVAVRVLWQKTREEAGVVAGTAFLALYYNAQRGLVDTPTLKEAVYAAASDLNTKPSVRVTALQICAVLNDTRAVSIARSLLNTDGDAHLKMSALAVIGSQGGPTDIPILNHYAQNSDIRLRTSAQAALEGFYRRNESSNQKNES